MGKVVFELNSKNDKFIENCYKKAMKELNEFFGMRWTKYIPVLIIVNNRKLFDKILRKKTEGWHGATSTREAIYILKYGKIQNIHSKEDYYAIIKHELCHQFYDILSKRNFKPIWLDEGLAIYLSGQLLEKKIPIKFGNFLKFYSKFGKEVYQESGFAVELLIKKFGKKKILQLIKSIGRIKTEEEFKRNFKKIYGFELNYKEINKLWGK